MSERLMVATETYTANVDGAPFFVEAGVTLVDEDDELVRRHPGWWEPAGGRSRPSVEQATAEPGKKRGQ